MSQSVASRITGRLPWLDQIADPVQKLATSLLTRDGAPTTLKGFLNGRPLGHALHPVLTDVPIGAWTAALAMDLMSAGGAEGLERGADTALGLGIAGAAGAALAGVADWSDTDGETRRMGMLHALLNTSALALNIISLLRRRGGDRGSAMTLSMAAYGLAMAAGSLGGELVYAKGLGVSHQIWPEPPADFTAVIDESALPENKLTRARAGDVSVCLLRRGDEIYAFEEWCSHLGGPLAEGELNGDFVTCPWHASQFDVTSGTVARGPATIPLRTFTTRLREGKVEVQPAG